jgi:deazaflavin-dependent oxidoreductase (nitroreductase family)
VTHLGARLHGSLYRASGGRFLGHVRGQPVLLLVTRGRRSHRPRLTPLQYLAQGDNFVVVASGRGARRVPAWYRNLRAYPHARVWIGPEEFAVRAREPRGEERIRTWSALTSGNRELRTTARKAGRPLPIVVLERL